MSNQINWSDYFDYREGVLYWKVRLSCRTKIGAIAGNIGSDRYFEISVNNKSYKRHRIIWEMFNGPIPEGMVIDHINDVRGDDRIENLQCITFSDNRRKQIVSRNRHALNTSGRQGVSWNIRDTKWQATIRIDGKQKHLGHYNSMLDAVAARMRAEREFLHLRGKSS